MSVVVERIVALFDALTMQDVAGLPPIPRQQFQQRCEHWARLATTRPQHGTKSGVLHELSSERARGHHPGN